MHAHHSQIYRSSVFGYVVAKHTIHHVEVVIVLMSKAVLLVRMVRAYGSTENTHCHTLLIATLYLQVYGASI